MTIKTATLNGVATIEIARPEKKNALTVAMYQAMADALNAAQADAAVRAVLITGQPGIFTSGNDIEDFMSRPPGSGSDNANAPVFQFMKALVGIDKPVVAAVTGAAIGIGTTMLLHCDLVYVSDEARLAMPFVSLGLVPEFASSLIVPRLLGNVKAAEKLLLGDPFSPEDAVEARIANAVLPAGEVVNHARRVAERFNGLPPGEPVLRSFDAPAGSSFPLDFTVEPGSGMRQVARQLTDAGIDTWPFALVMLARVTRQANGIKAGSYEVEAGVTPLLLLDKLTRGEPFVGAEDADDGLGEGRLVVPVRREGSADGGDLQRRSLGRR